MLLLWLAPLQHSFAAWWARYSALGIEYSVDDSSHHLDSWYSYWILFFLRTLVALRCTLWNNWRCYHSGAQWTDFRILRCFIISIGICLKSTFLSWRLIASHGVSRLPWITKWRDLWFSQRLTCSFSQFSLSCLLYCLSEEGMKQAKIMQTFCSQQIPIMKLKIAFLLWAGYS